MKPSFLLGCATALFTACTAAPGAAPSNAPAGPAADPAPAGPAATGPQPAWITKETFTARREGLVFGYGVGKVELDEATLAGCWDARLMIKAAENRGRAALAQLYSGVDPTATPGKEVDLGQLGLAEAELGWYDGARTLWVLVRAPTPQGKKLPPPEPSAPDGGLPPEGLIEALRAANQATLEAEGKCSDPHLRSTLPCCGLPEAFCSDPSRYDTQAADGTCSCGGAAPCLFDFTCGERNGERRCLCNGPKCPCEVRNCNRGETCGDGRCY